MTAVDAGDRAVLAALDGTGAAARAAGPGDAVAGVPPRFVAEPADLAQAAAVMRVAHDHGLSVAPRGRGTKLDWGYPPSRCELVVDTRRMARVVEHAAGDLVVRVEAGLPLDELQDLLGAAGQRLALDVPLPGGTVGGVLATALSGPRRLLYGTARDLLIGITVVRADGTVARSGGKVVKNVAGYDLGKLYTGSYGTLGLIADATFRLHPRPAAQRFVLAEADTPETAQRWVAAVRASSVVPTAVELDRAGGGGPTAVAVLVEGAAAGAGPRAGQVAALLGAGASVREEAPPWWNRLPGRPGGLLLRIGCPTGAVAGVLAALDRAGASAVRGSAGTASLFATPPEPLPSAEDPAGWVERVRADVAALGGTAVVLRAPAGAADRLDLWGPVPGAALMRAIKSQFDPDHRLNPSRFLGWRAS
ncbi:FAD-binding oxidoreductase [Allonocardiopsis opalescens]|nr:FAD-binding oxidoreductase [Allonocardiopsis opalescens]